MPSNAILYRAPFGIPGSVSRAGSTVEPWALGATAFTAYGLFAKLVAGLLVPIGGGDTPDKVAGLLVRAYPSQGANASDPLGTAVPPTSGMGSLLTRGYASVLVARGTAAIGGQVYVRVTANGYTVGAIEAAPADPDNCIAVPGARFMSAKDADGNAEIAFNV